MRKVLISLSFLILTLTILLAWVMLDGYRIYRFRTSDAEITVSAVDHTGLKGLHLSGSNKIVFRDLYRKLEKLNVPVYVIDLSSDSDGYIDEFTADFFGYPHSASIKHLIRRLIVLKRLSIYPEDLRQEAEVAKCYNFHYYHLPLPTRTLPDPSFVDQFIKVIDEIPVHGWIHTYCQKGRGRTSLAMVMVDMLRNSHQVSCEEIIRRQYLLGSQDLANTTLGRSGTYDQFLLIERKKFIFSFCHYAQQRKTGRFPLWSQWVAATQEQPKRALN